VIRHYLYRSNNEEDGPNEEDKTKNLNVIKPITCRKEVANKELNIQLHPNKSPAILVPDCKDNKEEEIVTINCWLKELLLLFIESDKVIIQCPKSWLNSSVIDATQAVLCKHIVFRFE